MDDDEDLRDRYFVIVGREEHVFVASWWVIGIFANFNAKSSDIGRERPLS